MKLFFQRWRTFCDLKQLKFACFDQDGTEHLHIVLWSEKPFELGYELPFKAPSLRLQPVSNGWMTPSINGYSLVCLRPHNNAENLFSYILSDRNFNLGRLRSSRRHFYSTSQGINTVALKRAFRRFCVISGTVRKSTEQLGTVLSQLQDSQERAESVQSFIAELFGISRDAAPGRSNEIILSGNRSSRLAIPYSESKRRQHLFFEYEYLPFPEREIDLIIPDLSTFGPKFQSRLIPKLLYDMVWHAWAKDPCMSVPPIPLEDFYSDDFLSVGAESSFELPTNPNYLASRQLSLSVLKT